MTNDLINGGFELIAGLLLWINVWKLYKDKRIRGISVLPVVFFTFWGYWNLYFYPSVSCWYSFFAGIMVVLANTTWIFQVLYYLRREKQNVRREV